MKRQNARTLVQAATLGTICAALVAAPAFTRQDAPGAPKKDEPQPGAQPATPPAPAPSPAPTPAPANPSPQPDKPAPKPDAPAPTSPAPSSGAGTTPADQPVTSPPSSTPPPSTTPSTTPAPKSDSPAPAKPADIPKPPPPRDPRNGRILQGDDTTTLSFKGVTVEQVLPFIVEATGKVVVPRPELLSRKITIFNDQRIKRSRALDLVFFALQQEGIAVIETDEMVILINIADLVKGDVPVLGPDDSTLKRDDFGTVVEKIFQLRNGSAKNVVEALEEAKTLPDYAKVTLDNNTNQLVVMGNIGLLQRIEKLVNSMDQRSSEALSTETFHLKYADAEKIAANIRELFSEDANANRNQGNQGQNRNFGFFPQQDQQRQRGRGAGTNQDSVLSQNLRVTANTQQNAVTVLAEKRVLNQIADAVYEQWDLPLGEDQVVPKVYKLKYIDPIKVRDVLDSLFGKGSSGSTPTQGNQGGGRGGGNQGNQQQGGSSGTSQGVGRLAGQFTFEAVPDAGKLVVVAKSPDNITAIDKIIEELDQPNNAGLPTIIELKHASAEELAEQLNTLLAQEGTFAQLNRAETGLTSQSSATSPFADTTATTTNNTTANQATATNVMRFWWQQARIPTDFAGTSNLVAKVRIVPVWRQNAVMLISPPEYREALETIIDKMDQPGRQVLISGIVFEISLDDATALGLRWSNANIVPTNPDNAINISNNISGTQGNLIDSFFDTSVLQTTTNLNVLIQALSQKTNVHILSEPRIFTSDNQEADFFSGQDIPFVNELQNNNNGDPTQSFTYRAVGIRLAVRPRITVKKDVDLRVNLTLSSVAPGQANSNAFIVDRRETNTHLIVKNGQTVVISGIIRREDSQITRKIPLLGDLPLIGALFTSIEYEHSNTELIAFVTPIVMENTDEATKVYEKDRDRLSEMRKDLDNKDGKKSEATDPDKVLPPPGTTDNPAPPPPPPSNGGH